MPEISLVHASHKLNVAPSAKSIRQKVRRFHPDRHLVIQNEVDNLLHNGFIRAMKYPEWLANVVVVPKKGNKWRVCVDYTDLNDACPKDSFPLPRIDQIVDASARHGMLSFLDAFSRYHQIPIHPPDAEATIQVLAPPKPIPEYFRLRSNHAASDHSMPKRHIHQIDRKHPSFCNPFTSRCPSTINCPSLPDE